MKIKMTQKIMCNIGMDNNLSLKLYNYLKKVDS